jgi:diacylglycerol kinase
MKTKRILDAFKYALAGLAYFFRHERNGRIQSIIAIIATVTSVLLRISKGEWIMVLFCIGAVLSAEMMNSALEKLCDHLHPSFHPQIKIVKDVAAGSVLFISLISALIGAMIFAPKIWQLLVMLSSR